MSHPQGAAAPTYRPLRFGVTRVVTREGAQGTLYASADQALDRYDARMSDRLLHWAHATPDVSFMAQRVRDADSRLGDWRHLSYAQALDAARRIGQALLDRGLSPERPVLILSENSLDHALLALGCLWAGVYALENPGSDKWKYRPLMSVVSSVVLSWLLPYSAATLRRSVWVRGVS